MSSPAIRALKETFNAKITVLTSSMASDIARYMEEIDEVVVCDLPWVKNSSSAKPDTFLSLVAELKKENFDMAVIFTVYSQNPMPASMLAYLAEIPARLAYCRENPYDLLTHWLPDSEPYSAIKHQVRRDLDLVASIGARPTKDNLSIQSSAGAWESTSHKLMQMHVDLKRPWIILHAGVSEAKRAYPSDLWSETAQKLIKEMGYQVLFTGNEKEKTLTDDLTKTTGNGAFSLGGVLSLEEFVSLVKNAPLIISVNTGTIHIAAAAGTPLIVLYAMSNPQHSPWKAKGKVLPFSVRDEKKSRNEVIRYVNATFFSKKHRKISPNDILQEVDDIRHGKLDLIPEIPKSFTD